MTDTWTTHHTGAVGGRIVEVKTYSDGSYRVSTTQGADYPGSVSGDDSSIIIIPPSAKGNPVDIEGKTIEEVREQLLLEGFAGDQVEEILSHFP
jgi:hypothetical protein